MRLFKRIALQAFTLCFILFSVFGAHSLATAPNIKTKEQQQLQEELEQNAAQLETQNHAAAAP